MVTEAQHRQIESVLYRCERYWRENEVPQESIAEMRGELEQHLREAAEDGKSTEEVTGAELEAFAESWAVPNRRVRALRHEVIELVSDTLAALVVIVVLVHLFLRSPSIPVSWEFIAYAISTTFLLLRIFAYFREPSGSAPGSEESLLDRLPKWVQGSVMALILVSMFAWAFLPLPTQKLFGWPWPATAATLAAAALVRGSGRLIRYRESEEPLHRGRTQRGDARGPGRIEEALLDCELQWQQERIPDDEIESMRADLEQHLREAAADGRSPEEVVGPDPRGFAEAWARQYGVTIEEPPPPSLAHRVQGWVFGTATFFAVAATLFHVLGWSGSVPIVWFPMLLLLVLGSALFGKVLESLKRPGKRRWSRSWAAISGSVLWITGLSFALALFAWWGQRVITFEWPWQATVVSVAVACGMVLYWLKTADR